MREDWVECTFEEIVYYSKGKKPKTLFKEGGDKRLPYINIKAFEKNIIDEYSDDEKVNFCQSGNILMVWDGARAGFSGKSINGIVGSTLMKILPVTYLDNNFLFYYLQSLYKYLNTNTKGVGIPHVEPNLLWKRYVGLPPLPEQRAIVKKIEALFSSLDAGISDLKKAQEQLKIYRQAVLKKAFEGELTKEWRKNQTNLPSAEELLKKIEEEREKYYSQQIEDWKQAVALWEENGKVGKKPDKPSFNKIVIDNTIIMESGFFAKLGSISNVVRGGSPRPAGDKRFYDGNIPFLKVADLTRINTKYVTEYSYTIKEAGLQKTRFLKKGTLVLSNSGATLGVARVLGIDATANDGVAAFLDLLPQLVDFLYFYLNSKTEEFRSINQGAGQPNLNTDLLKDYSVPIFSINEQAQIVKEIEARLSVCDAVEKQIQDSLDQAEALRQSILKKAFEGRLLSEEELNLCKQAPDYEPASVLLAKIKAEKEANKPVKKKTMKKK